MKKNKVSRRRELLEAHVLKHRRLNYYKILGQEGTLTTIELAKQVGLAQSSVARVERGDNAYGDTKSKMIRFLFPSYESFNKRVFDRDQFLREISPSIEDDFEKHRLERNSEILSSKLTLNDYDLRNLLFNRFASPATKASNERIDLDVIALFERIHRLITAFYKWHTINLKIERSIKYYADLKKQKKEIGSKSKIAKTVEDEELELRLKNVYSYLRLNQLKKSFAYYHGKKGKFFIRQFILQLYKLFTDLKYKKHEAIHLTFLVAKSFIKENQKAVFSKYRYFDEIFQEKIINKRNNDGDPEHKIILNMIDEATKNNPIISDGCRYSLLDFIYLYSMKQSEAISTS